MIRTLLWGYNIQACRQAMTFVGQSRFSLPKPESKDVFSLVLSRNLNQTVKKRTLEARSKLKNTEYSNKCPCPDHAISNQKETQTKKSRCRNNHENKHDSKSSTPTSATGSSENGGGNIKWILAALAATGAGAAAWFVLGKEEENNKSNQSRSEDTPKRVPADSANLPKKVPYLLVGGGTASFSAFRAIKSNDPKAKVLVISNELLKPYMRPPLSKELWYASEPGVVPKDYRFKQWTGAERSLFFEPDEFFVDPTKLSESANGGIAVAQGYAVKKIDAKNRIATLTDGTEIQYEKCLLATGCTPKNLPVFENAPKNTQDKIMFYRSPNDFEKLKKLVDVNKSITIVGNGFLGSELSCSLASYSKNSDVKINQIYPESGNMSKVLPEYLSKWTTKKVEQQGVCVVPGVQVKEVSREQNGLKLALSNGQNLLTDVAVVCVGCEANTDIANISGLEVDGDLGGFVVNAELEARQNLFVAGDASCFYDPLLGRRRLEHHDHSVISGRLAGENMVAKNDIKKPYEHQSMFWSDLGPTIGYEGIGRTEASLPTVGVFALPDKDDRKTDNLQPTSETPKSESEQTEVVQVNTASPPAASLESNEKEYGRGVIFYLKDDKIVGIILWNLFNRIGLARTIVNQNKSYKDLNEVAKLFEIHS